MRPIRLEIEGLQSFSEKQVIDFDELTSMGLFGIFGETGSGKSTILDGIIFALFDEIPRTMGRQGKGIRPCLNHNCDTLQVIFEFALGENIFNIKRAYKKKYSKKGEEKFEQQNPILKINNEIVADTVSSVKNKIDDFLGIGVNDFTRSVVLPQGKFSEFLKLKGTEKVSMLENIFELEKYGSVLSEKLKVKNNKVREEINALENQIKGKGDISLEKISELEKEVKEIFQNKEKILLEKRKIENEYQEKKKIKELSEELEKIKENLNLLQNEESEIDSLRDKVSKHKIAMEFKAKIEDVKNLKDEYNSEKKLYLEEQVKLEKKEDEKNELLKLESKKNIELKSIELELEKLNFNYEDLEKVRVAFEIIQKYSVILVQKKELGNEINELKKRRDEYLKSLDELNKRKEILKDVSFLEKEIEKNNSELDEKNRCFQELKIKEAEVAKQIEIIEKNKEIISLKKSELENLKVDFKEKEKKLESIERDQKKSWAYILSKDLKDNTPCPVCGSTSHPNIVLENKEIDLESLKVLEEEIEKFKNRKLFLEKEIEDLEKNIDVDGDLETIISEIENLEKNIKEIKENKFSLEKKISKVEKERVEIESNILNITKNNEESINKISQKEKKVKSLEYELDEDIKRYQSLNLNLNFEIEEILNSKKELEEKERKRREIFENRENLKNEIQTLLNRKNKSLEEISILKSDIARKDEKISSIYKILDEKYNVLKLELKNSGFDEIKEVLEKLLDENIAANYEEKIREYEENLKKYLNLKEDYENRLQGKECSLEKWQWISQKYIEVQDKEKEIGEKYAILSSNLEKSKNILTEIEGLRTKIEAFRKEQDDILHLQKKFEGKKFVRFLARKKLTYIVHQASKRLKKVSKGRYSLQIDENCDFNIVDSFNENKVRECSTLSGGETFVVSLVLALALSSQLQLKGNVQLEFFFLDEGFGTLDSVLLDRVIEILEEIKWKEKIKIGIISHVEELKIRIPRRLEVTAAIPGEIGSRVKLV